MERHTVVSEGEEYIQIKDGWLEIKVKVPFETIEEWYKQIFRPPHKPPKKPAYPWDYQSERDKFAILDKRRLTPEELNILSGKFAILTWMNKL